MSCLNAFDNAVCGSLHKGRTLRKIIKFSPPNPSKYSVTFPTDYARGPLYAKCSFKYNPQTNGDYNYYPWISTECYLLKSTENPKNEVVTLVIKNASIPKDKEFTILYSHGSSTDLGELFPTLVSMSVILKCNVVSYDYVGYGWSKGELEEEKFYFSIDEVIDFCLSTLKIRIESLILFGKTIGAIPSLYAASEPSYCSVCGVILISPVVSGRDLAQFEESLHDLNSKKFTKDILCPVLLIHGALDQIVPIRHSVIIYQSLSKKFTWFPKKGSHYLERESRDKYYTKIKSFIECLKNCRNKIKKALFEKENTSSVIELSSRI